MSNASACSYCLADDPEFVDFDGDTICADCCEPDPDLWRDEQLLLADAWKDIT